MTQLLEYCNVMQFMYFVTQTFSCNCHFISSKNVLTVVVSKCFDIFIKILRSLYFNRRQQDKLLLHLIRINRRCNAMSVS